MDRNDLALLHREVGVVLLQECHLGEIPRENALLDVVVVGRNARLVVELEVQLLQNAFKLLADVVCRLDVPAVDEVLIAPVRGAALPLVLVIGVQKRQVVAVGMNELCSGIDGLRKLVLGADKEIGHVEARHDA